MTVASRILEQEPYVELLLASYANVLDKERTVGSPEFVEQCHECVLLLVSFQVCHSISTDRTLSPLPGTCQRVEGLLHHPEIQAAIAHVLHKDTLELVLDSLATCLLLASDENRFSLASDDAGTSAVMDFLRRLGNRLAPAFCTATPEHVAPLNAPIAEPLPNISPLSAYVIVNDLLAEVSNRPFKKGSRKAVTPSLSPSFKTKTATVLMAFLTAFNLLLATKFKSLERNMAQIVQASLHDATLLSHVAYNLCPQDLTSIPSSILNNSPITTSFVAIFLP